ncbi:MAG: glycosyltransferase family 9 protein [Thiothrix sp.]|uniref:glycosyltransferase family 9 protein n=1 Tax=Thiothrix sp. TaxID=1032 RepID=UPI00261AD621|nr:glycosyltransferase family 9 protein [Thiothrix sp.]MDD5395175.1 glycosyltransferase family 9 protein [Thiothrix sp.]
MIEGIKKYAVVEAESECFIGEGKRQIHLQKGDKFIMDAGLVPATLQAKHAVIDERGVLLYRHCLRPAGLLPKLCDRVVTRLGQMHKRVLILRYGGLGDVLMMAELAAHLTNAGHEVGIACDAGYADVLEYMPHLVARHAVPMLLKELERYDAVLVWDECERDIHWLGDVRLAGVDIWARVTWLPLPLSLLDNVVLTLPAEKIQTHRDKLKTLWDDYKPLCVIQAGGSTISKTPPPTEIAAMCIGLAKDYHVMLTLSEELVGRYQRLPKDTVDAMKAAGVQVSSSRSLGGVTDWLCLLACADLIIAPDSAALHAARLLDIQSIGLFCPTDGKQWHGRPARIRHIEGVCSIHPCFGPDMEHLSMPCLCPDKLGYAQGFAGMATKVIEKARGLA